MRRRRILITGASSGLGAEMARQFEREVASAPVPAWPWRPISAVMKHAPLRVVRRLS